MNPEPGEQVFFHGHPSWRGILSFYLRGLLLAIIAGALTGGITAIASNGVKAEWVVVAVLVVFLLVLLIGFIKRVSTTYTITNQRLTIKSGILSRQTHQTRLERVQNVNTSQTVIDRLLRVGRVDFDTAALLLRRRRESARDRAYGRPRDPRVRPYSARDAAAVGRVRSPA